MWRIGKKIEQEKSPFFPRRTYLPNNLISIYAGGIKHYERLLVDSERKLVEEVNNRLGINGLLRTEALETVITINHPKDIEPLGSLRRYIYFFFRKRPSIRNIAFGTDMGLIIIELVNLSLGVKGFKFLQILGLVRIKLRRGNTPWMLSYTSISYANADKKRLNVKSLASFPVAVFQASLVIFTLCLSASIALRTCTLARTIHDSLASLSQAGTQTFDSFGLETFYPIVDALGRHFRLLSGMCGTETFGFEQYATATHPKTIALSGAID